MSGVPIPTEEEAKESIMADMRAYLETYHTNDLALFLPTLEPYLDMSVADLEDPEKRPETDFMLLEMSVNVVDLASQALGNVWLQILQGTLMYVGKQGFEMVKTRIKARILEATQDENLAERMGEFFARRFEKRGT